MVLSKLLWNSTISTKGARFAGADIKNMYLETPLDRYEYMQMPLSFIPQDIIQHYGLPAKALKGYIYMEIWKGMYGLPQAGILANKLLKNALPATDITNNDTLPASGHTQATPLVQSCSRRLWY
jgi:hypothetical protein